MNSCRHPTAAGWPETIGSPRQASRISVPCGTGTGGEKCCGSRESRSRVSRTSGGMHPRGLHLQMHPWQQPNLYWQQGQPRAASSQRPSRPDADVAASSVRLPAAAKAPSVRAAPPKGPPDVLSKAVQTADELYTPAPRSLKMLALGDTPSPVKDMATSPIIWSKTPLPPSPSWTDSTRDSAERESSTTLQQEVRAQRSRS